MILFKDLFYYRNSTSKKGNWIYFNTVLNNHISSFFPIVSLHFILNFYAYFPAIMTVLVHKKYAVITACQLSKEKILHILIHNSPP